MTARPFRDGRLGSIATLLLAPAVAAALSVVAIDGLELLPPTPPLALTGTFTEALRDSGVERAYAFLQSGVDPNGLLPGTDATGPGLASPLDIAVAAGNENVVLMLLGNGVRLDLPANARAICTARRVGRPDLAESIERYRQGMPAVDCGN